MNWKYIPLLSVFALAGCDGTAIEFAKQTKAMLDAYEKSINNQIAAEMKYYNADAAIAKSADARQFEDSLGATRDEISTELSVAYLDGKKSVGLYRTEIRAYAQTEFDSRKSSYGAAVDATLPYIQQLAKLEANKETVDALDKALGALAQKRGLRAEATDLKSFVSETKTDFDLMVCKDLADKKSKLDDLIKTETDAQRKTADQAQSDSLAKLRTDRKCDDLEKAAKAATPAAVPAK